MKSILQTNKECYVCKTTYNLHLHHVIFGTGRRKQSDKYGLTVWLCGRHHNLSNEGVHFNKALDIQIKQDAERKFLETHSMEEWFSIFGKNYLD